MSDYVLDAVVLGSIYTLFTLGLTLSWGVLGMLNLAHGAVFMSGALSAYLIADQVQLSIWLLLPIAMLITGGLVVLLEVLAFRPIRNRASSDHAAELAIVIASVGAGSALVAWARNRTGGYAVSIAQTSFRARSFEALGMTVTDIELVIVAVALLSTAALSWFIGHSRHGRALRAVAQDRYMTSLLGISANRLALGTMFVSGALAGAAGVLLAAHLNAVSANMGETLLLKAFAAIVLGGIGSIWGAAVGAYVLASAEIAAVVFVSVGVRDTVAFVLIIGLLLLRPRGLLAAGSWERS